VAELAKTVPEFEKGDVIIPIGGTIPCTILGLDEYHYFVRWFDSGDSMLWITEVDKNYVKVGMDDEEDE
jgi:predicted RNA-binding protein with RPS1 domain